MQSEPRIAVVGVAGLFPGADSLDRYWANVRDAVDASSEPPPGRWLLGLDECFDPAVGTPDHVYSRRAYFLADVPTDPDDLPGEPGLLARLDPAFRLALHVGRHAFADARMHNVDRRRVGVILGNIALPTDGASALAREYLGEPAGDSPEPLNRFVAGLPAGLLAKSLGLGGGTFTLDAACASSLYAIKLACDELRAGRADAMLAGGMSRPDSLYTQMGFAQLRALSPTGRCSPFDAAGDGLVVGEGCGVVVLKRLDDALRDGDQIHATLAGCGLSNDVEGNLLAPASEGQLRAMRSAYRQAGWDPAEVDLVECHATGTPVGDRTEFASLRELWADAVWRPGQCVLGSAKANVGHLLTAAGSAGLIRVLLAMKHATLPPTANFQTPAPQIDLADSPFAVLAEARPWHRRAEGVPRRAAVSAFGFGGINAHLLVEEFLPENAPAPSRDRRPPAAAPGVPVAIVGMDARFGPWQSLQAFQERVLGGGPAHAPTTVHRHFRDTGDVGPGSVGYGIDAVDVPLDQFRTPPSELRELLPQQLLALRSAAAALADAGWPADAPAELRHRTGVFLGVSLDLNTTNFHLRWHALKRAREEAPDRPEWHKTAADAVGPPLSADRTMGALASVAASRVARAFGLGGPSFTVSSEDTSAAHALALAVRALQRGELDRAVVGGVDLCGDPRVVKADDAGRPFSRSGLARPFDATADGPLPGDGAATVVIKRLDDALRDGDRVYAVVRGVGAASGGAPTAWVPGEQAYAESLRRAYLDAAAHPATVELVEAHASGSPAEDALEAAVLSRLFPAGGPAEGDGPPPDVMLSASKADVGHTGAAAPLAGLVKVALCLHQEVVPPVRHSTTPRPELAGSRLRVPQHPRFWLHDSAAGPRRAALSALSVDGNCVHVVLEQSQAARPADEPARLQPLGERAEGLFAVEADSPAGLVSGLEELARFAESAGEDAGIEGLARAWWRDRPTDIRRTRAVALVARRPAELREQVAFVRDHLRDHFDEPLPGREQGTASGSLRDRLFYSPSPLGPGGQLAFVFPGSGSHFAGMGRDLGVQWPAVLRRQQETSTLLRGQYAPDLFWPAGNRLDEVDGLSAIWAQVSLGTLVGDLVRSFGVRPDAVIGQSLGESAGLFTLGAWRDRDEMFRRMRKSTLFTHDLAGEYRAARAAWRLPAEAPPVEWLTGVVACPADAVRQHLKPGGRAYLQIVCTPDECVIGGEREAVEELVAALGVRFLPLTGVTVAHCEVAKVVEAPYRGLHLLPTTPPDGVRFYSGALARSYTLHRDSAADAIVGHATNTIDYPRLIETAYADGVRLFVELGPGGSCTRMIRSILGDRPHIARTACASRQDGVSLVLRLLGHLLAERVPLDLTALYGAEPTAVGVVTPQGPELRVPVGRGLGKKPALPAEKTPPPGHLPEADTGGKNGKPVVAIPHLPSPALAAKIGGAGEKEGRATRQVTPSPLRGEGRGVESSPVPVGQVTPVLAGVASARVAAMEAHEAYLRLHQSALGRLGGLLAFRGQLAQALTGAEAIGEPTASGGREFPVEGTNRGLTPPARPEEKVNVRSGPVPFLDTAGCFEFARGSIAAALGPTFAGADAFPTRVRLPDGPLMLVDNVLTVEGTPKSMTNGRVVTDHAVHDHRWYLDNGRMPTCVAVEAGQADLFLSGYLGIDFQTRGLACYRLLDAVVTFHRGLPRPGERVEYDIHIDEFFRQGDTWLFRFRFDGTVNGEPLLTMRNGCAGFFTEAELAAGKGVVQTALQRRPMPGKLPADWRPLAPVAGVEAYPAEKVACLERGDLAGCFGPAFAGVPLREPTRLPGGMLHLVHRVTELDPAGGRFAIGRVRAEADIHPDDWFLTCHFVDDMVMPGTLMYECCLHTFRVFLMRLGWVGEHAEVGWEPVPGVQSRLKCRGQVVATTKVVTYEVTLKEIGYGPEPYAIADALMYADGKPIVEITDMSVCLTGTTREQVEGLWRAAKTSLQPLPEAERGTVEEADAARSPLFDRDRILAFAIGKPSEAFGDRYRVFDAERVIARLPGPPYQFLDRIVHIDGCEPWKMVAGGTVVAEYDVPPGEWYFAADRQPRMPFAVLLEVALQPCGWLAAYVGSALTSPEDLRFRNLGGTATHFAPVGPDAGTLTTTVKMTRVSSSGGMIIQHYDLSVRGRSGKVYEGNTYFGFFSKTALAEQVGVRDARPYTPPDGDLARARACPYPDAAPFPDRMLRMTDAVTAWLPEGGSKGLGFVRGTKVVDPAEWFFAAHFYQDPVCPGSLGLESFQQLLKFAAAERWGAGPDTLWESPAIGRPHTWVYRGQIIPTNRLVTVEADLTHRDDARRELRADGVLKVDGKIIYQMKDFSLRMGG